MASWTTPTIFATGNILDVASANVWSNNETFLYQAPYANYFNSSATSLANNGFTQVTLGGTDSTGYGFSLSGSNIIVPLSGTYFVSGTVALNPSAASGEAATCLYHQGTNAKNSSGPNSSSIGVSYPVSGGIKCAASDSLGLYGFQNSGGAVNTLTGSSSTFISVFFIGSQ